MLEDTNSLDGGQIAKVKKRGIIVFEVGKYKAKTVQLVQFHIQTMSLHVRSYFVKHNLIKLLFYTFIFCRAECDGVETFDQNQNQMHVLV